mgnify:CR=1 FL=1
MNYNTMKTISDFTEANYAAMLKQAARRFRVMPVREATTLRSKGESGIAAWRHDIDFSPHRALSFARIEAKSNVKSSYYVLLNGAFYNPLEKAIMEILQEIRSLGHTIGLHFDASLTHVDLEERVTMEANLLSSISGYRVECISIHNPGVNYPLSLKRPQICGLFNASLDELRNMFVYSSDSNGYWRYRPMPEVIDDSSVENIYTLTHAEWWTHEAMTPAKRLSRCIDGRAKAVAADYQSFIRTHRSEALADV